MGYIKFLMANIQILCFFIDKTANYHDFNRATQLSLEIEGRQNDKL